MAKMSIMSKLDSETATQANDHFSKSVTLLRDSSINQMSK